MYVYHLHHALLKMDASVQMTFVCCKQNSLMKWIIVSETTNCETRKWTDLLVL